MNFALEVISGFSEFLKFLFGNDEKTLSNCKIISSAYAITILGGFEVPI